MSEPKEKNKLVVKDKREKVGKGQKVVGLNLTELDTDEYDTVDIEMDIEYNEGDVVGIQL